MSSIGARYLLHGLHVIGMKKTKRHPPSDLVNRFFAISGHRRSSSWSTPSEAREYARYRKSRRTLGPCERASWYVYMYMWMRFSFQRGSPKDAFLGACFRLKAPTDTKIIVDGSITVARIISFLFTRNLSKEIAIKSLYFGKVYQLISSIAEYKFVIINFLGLTNKIIGINYEWLITWTLRLIILNYLIYNLIEFFRQRYIHIYKLCFRSLRRAYLLLFLYGE